MKVLSVIEKFDLQFANFGLAVPRVDAKAHEKEVLQILKMWVPYGGYFDLCHFILGSFYGGLLLLKILFRHTIK